MSLDQYHSRQLVMLSGKGGVGKTTLSCAFARYWAQSCPDKQILLVSTDPAHSLGDVLQITVDNTPRSASDLPNLGVRALDAKLLLNDFRERYGDVLQLLVERGSFVAGEDLTPVWDLDWPGIDELMGLLEIQRLLRENVVDGVVVDMAPSGHALNLLELMDFLDNLLGSLDLFQEKHRTISKSLTGRYFDDEGDDFLREMREDLEAGRELLENPAKIAFLLVAIPQPMSFSETARFVDSLAGLNIPLAGLLVNHIVTPDGDGDIYQEQQQELAKFQKIMPDQPIFLIPEMSPEPLGDQSLDILLGKITPLATVIMPDLVTKIEWPTPIPPSLPDFISQGKRLIIIGGKGGVGKTTVAGAIGWGLAAKYPERKIRLISIDPAHSLGDAFGLTLGHQPQNITPNLSGQEINAEEIIDQFRADYLWELAAMMSGDKAESSISLAYGPEAWRRIVSQSLPGIDEMLSLVEIMSLLEKSEQDLIILDTAPTGHLLKFLAMPTALSDWLAWIFKLWIKYQDTLGRTEFMGRLRDLRKRVIQAQKSLKNSEFTEFIAVVQAQAAIIAEAERLTVAIREQGIAANYIIHNRFQPDQEIAPDIFPHQTIVKLPPLPRNVSPGERLAGAANLLLSK